MPEEEAGRPLLLGDRTGTGAQELPRAAISRVRRDAYARAPGARGQASPHSGSAAGAADSFGCRSGLADPAQSRSSLGPRGSGAADFPALRSGQIRRGFRAGHACRKGHPRRSGTGQAVAGDFLPDVVQHHAGRRRCLSTRIQRAQFGMGAGGKDAAEECSSAPRHVPLEVRKIRIRHGSTDHELLAVAILGAGWRRCRSFSGARRNRENATGYGARFAGALPPDTLHSRIRGPTRAGSQGLLDRPVRGYQPAVQGIR